MSALAQTYSFEPARPLQGQALKVFGPKQAAGARFHGKTVHLFPQADGRSFALMPVGVLTKPGSYKLEWLDEKNTPIHEQAVMIGDAHFKKQNIVLSHTLSNLHATPDERKTVSTFLDAVSSERFWQEPFDPPIPGCLTSPFGVMRLHNGKPTGDYHAGLDQRGAFGSPVHAIANGVVKVVQPFELHGGTVALDHGQGVESMYLHLSRFAVKEGEQVKAGDVIGYVGSSGRSTGPHLHWSLYASGQPINPLQWMKLSACPVEGSKRKPLRRVRTDYSWRNASTGSMCAARQAGTVLAMSAIRISPATASATVTGS
jgi:murein DD-endopeptidase MepM/ murein hydrolase activator NlpD